MSNFAFDPSAIAFTLLTYYPKWYQGKLQSIKHTDKIRGDISLEFMQKAVKMGHQVVVIDGKSSKTYQKALHTISELHIFKRHTPKRSPNRRMAYKIASQLPNVKVLFVTEAEKLSILNFVPQLVLPILEGKADIVVPKRENKFFQSSYPSYMYESESEGNKLYNQTLRLNKVLPPTMEDLDMFFGPRVFRNDPQVFALLMKKFTFKMKNIYLPEGYFDPDEYSNAIYFPIILALKKKLPVASVEIPFVYPKMQKENEEVGELKLFIEKRRAQRLSLLLDLLYLLSYFKK